MSTVTVVPVEEWIDFFSHFKDSQILNPDFAISRLGQYQHCKLCDRRIPPGESERHMRQHDRDLKAYRERRRKENDGNAAVRLAEARRLKAEARDADLG